MDKTKALNKKQILPIAIILIAVIFYSNTPMLAHGSSYCSIDSHICPAFPNAYDAKFYKFSMKRRKNNGQGKDADGNSPDDHRCHD